MQLQLQCNLLPLDGLNVYPLQKDFMALKKGSRLFYDKLISDNTKPHVCQKWEEMFHNMSFDWQWIFTNCKRNLKM